MAAPKTPPRQRYRQLNRLEAALEVPMFVLSLAWLWLLVVEIARGLTPWQETAALLIWGLFVFELALKLLLAPRKRAFLKRNLLVVIALAVPALRLFRLLRGLRVLQAGRTLSSARFARALSSGSRLWQALKQARGPRPDPEMNVGVLIAVGGFSPLADLQTFARGLADEVQPLLQRDTPLRWHFHFTEPSALGSDASRRPSDFLDSASLRMAEGPFDMVLVITDVPLNSRANRLEAGLASPTTRTAVLSTRKLTAASRDNALRALDAPAVRRNGAALLLHLLGHLLALPHRRQQSGSVMSPFRFDPDRHRPPAFSDTDLNTLRRHAETLPERELHGGNVFERLLFHLLMAARRPRALLMPLLRNRAILLPLSLPSLATAAVAPTLLLIFTAEIWDVGLGMSNRTVTLYAVLSIVAATLYLVNIQDLLLPRREKRVLTEHLAVANVVIFISILLACVGLFLMVGGLTLLIEFYIFPHDLIQTWPTLDQERVDWRDLLRLAAFVSTVGMTTGALAGGLESRTVIQHLALFNDRP